MANIGFSELFLIVVLFLGPVAVLVGWLVLTLWRLRTEMRQLRARVAKLEKDRRDVGIA